MGHPTPAMRMFASPLHFRRIFVRGLFGIINKKVNLTPSQVVLVINNAIAIRHEQLFRRAQQAAARMVDTIPETAMSAEDCQVMRYVLEHPDPLSILQRRLTDDGVELWFNPMRLRRPRREADNPDPSLLRPFNRDGFSFLRLGAECFATETWNGHDIGAYYNKFPYGAWHFMLVPDVELGHPQYLTPELLELICALDQQVVLAMPDAVIGYNSLLAYASINHFHIHVMGSGRTLLARGRPDLVQSGLMVMEHAGAASAWPDVLAAQRSNQPFNLIHAGWLQLVPRKPQGSDGTPPWNTGLAWYELARRMIVTDLLSLRAVTDGNVRQAWSALAPERTLAAMAS